MLARIRFNPDTRSRPTSCVSASRSAAVRFTMYRFCIRTMEHTERPWKEKPLDSIESRC